ncbi:ATP-binding protein [Streptomyces sp. NPDC057271]|uniref:ATP-binding protein n=1 Tax=unclassified Streptomyces TaxID=2593676 RepID=UPI00363DD978
MGGRSVEPGGEESQGWECDIRLDRQLWMVRIVREALRIALCSRRSADFVDTACLLATEIVSNALLHGGGRVRVRLVGHRCGLHFSAVDRGAHAGQAGPARRPADDEAEGGRGLQLVEMCATRWGTGQGLDGVGSRVWFALDEHTCADPLLCEGQDNASTVSDIRSAPNARTWSG